MMPHHGSFLVIIVFAKSFYSLSRSGSEIVSFQTRKRRHYEVRRRGAHALEKRNGYQTTTEAIEYHVYAIIQSLMHYFRYIEWFEDFPLWSIVFREPAENGRNDFDGQLFSETLLSPCNLGMMHSACADRKTVCSPREKVNRNQNLMNPSPSPFWPSSAWTPDRPLSSSVLLLRPAFAVLFVRGAISYLLSTTFLEKPRENETLSS